MEPQTGQQHEAAATSPEARQRADQFFNEALRYIERMRWGDSSVALRRALAAVPGYPQASGLLTLVDEIRIHYDHGIPDSRQLEALRAYIAALRSSTPPPEPPPQAPTATQGTLPGGIALPWAEDHRILHHLRNNIEDPKNTILIVSWQAPNTLGRRLADPEKEVRIFGDTFKVKAQVATINGLSGHAGRDLLIQWATALKPRVKKVFLVHGEPESSSALAAALKGQGLPEVYTPQLHESAEI